MIDCCDLNFSNIETIRLSDDGDDDGDMLCFVNDMILKIDTFLFFPPSQSDLLTVYVL